jgi:hypothetical protein
MLADAPIDALTAFAVAVMLQSGEMQLHVAFGADRLCKLITCYLSDDPDPCRALAQVGRRRLHRRDDRQLLHGWASAMARSRASPRDSGKDVILPTSGSL